MNIASGVETRTTGLAHRINELTGNQAGVVTATPRTWDTKNRLLASTELAEQTISADFPAGMSSAVRKPKL